MLISGASEQRACGVLLGAGSSPMSTVLLFSRSIVVNQALTNWPFCRPLDSAPSAPSGFPEDSSTWYLQWWFFWSDFSFVAKLVLIHMKM
jgi:hypothetical protein